MRYLFTVVLACTVWACADSVFSIELPKCYTPPPVFSAISQIPPDSVVLGCPYVIEHPDGTRELVTLTLPDLQAIIDSLEAKAGN